MQTPLLLNVIDYSTVCSPIQPFLNNFNFKLFVSNFEFVATKTFEKNVLVHFNNQVTFSNC